MARFNPGQEVILICNLRPNQFAIYPKVGEIVTVAGKCPVYKNNIDITEYLLDKRGNPQSFKESWFAPIMDITELTEILEQQPEEAPCHN